MEYVDVMGDLWWPLDRDALQLWWEIIAIMLDK